jgi:hypothetical protein
MRKGVKWKLNNKKRFEKENKIKEKKKQTKRDVEQTKGGWYQHLRI